MMSNNHKNSGCGFAEELVSYLYGELGDPEIARFEGHLASCSICADELEAFSGLHFSIADWKAGEFAALAPPVIEIPYEKSAEPAAALDTSDARRSWTAALRGYFAPRGFALVAAAAAVLAVTIGVFLFARDGEKSDDVSRNNPKQEATPTPPNSDDKAGQTNKNANGSTPADPEKQPKPELVQKPLPVDPAEKTIDSTPKNGRPVKISNAERRPSPKTDATPKTSGVKPGSKKKNEVVVPDEDEDDTLRLAELFDEIETKD